MYNQNHMSTLSISPSRPRFVFNQLLRSLLLAVILLPAALLAFSIGYHIWFTGRIFPGVSLAGIDLSGMKPADAAVKISQAWNYPQRGTILLRDGAHTWAARPVELGLSMDYAAAALSAYHCGRQGNPFRQLLDDLLLWWQGTDLPPVITYDQGVSQQYLLRLAQEIDHPTIEASLGLNGAEVVVHSGEVGRTLNIPASLALLSTQVQAMQDGLVKLVVDETPPVIMDASQQAEIARRILSAPLVLTLPAGETGAGPWGFEPAVLAGMLSIQRVQDANPPRYEVVLDPTLLRTYLEDLAPKLGVAAQDAQFTFINQTHQLEVTQHAIIGRGLDIEASIQSINEKLVKGEHSIALIFKENKPTLTDDMTGDQLGIRELVQSTTTYFYGSSKERVQNIRTAASRFNGLMVAPGQTFSMAEALGDVSLDNGYAEALIIYGDQTIKGVGGGVCQVSTTLFRTVFFAGLQIDERHAHAYRVYYYEQRSNGSSDPNLAGLDATVFVPLVDFKFTNDTPYWLLMETYVDGYSLTWNFYSTSDGRIVNWESTGPTNLVEPPEPLYRENPDLSKDEIKQVDWAATGADITVTRSVSRDGNIILQDQFRTLYQPWRAIYEYGPGSENIPTPQPTQ
jgi:vancomycin resistance protein YoaR